MDQYIFVLLRYPNSVIQNASLSPSATSLFQSMPMEVIISILSYSDIWSCMNLSLSCRYFARVASNCNSLVLDGLNLSPHERHLISDPDFLPVKLLTARLEFVSSGQKLKMLPDRTGCKHCHWRRRPDTDYLDPTKWWRYNIWTLTIARNHFAPWVRSWGGLPTFGVIKLMLIGIRIMHEEFEKKQSRCGFLTLKFTSPNRDAFRAIVTAS